MSERPIPDEVMKAARAIAFDICPLPEEDEKASFRAAKGPAIARAIMAERERCAKIAEQSPQQTAGDRRRANAIASAIRGEG